MWICLNDAFFSIVQSDKEPEKLSVRARRKGDLERYWPSATVVELPNRDYAYRAFIPREQVASVISGALAQIDYPNFKNSVRDPALHQAYARVWGTLYDLQAG